MNAWADEDPLPVELPARSRRRLRGRHFVLGGLAVAASGPLASAVGALALGPMLVVLGLVVMCFGALGWWFETLGAWDDDPGTDPSSIRLTDVARLARRGRRH